MKRYNFLLLNTAIVIVMLSVSCQKSFFTGVNTNIDAPAYVPETNLLPPIENSLAYNQGGLVSRMTAQWTQQVLGAARQQAAYYSYAVTQGDFDAMWGNYYENVMENDSILMRQADANGNKEYSGISRIMMAYSLQSMVDLWGDIPYTNALEGVKNLQPTFDKATDIYTTIFNLLDAAITDLTDPSPGDLVPTAGNGADNIYNGNEAQWIEFAHAIKARLYIHQSKNNPTMATNALSEVSQSFQSNADNAVYYFNTIESNSAPAYQFNAQRGDLSYATSYLANLLHSLNDPRYDIFIDSVNDPNGLGLAAYYGSNNSPVELICKDEMDFVQAEAALRASGDFTTATTAYNNGISDNMSKFGIDATEIAAYQAANPLPTSSVQDALNQVALQEYIALYLNPEEFTTYRRSAVPSITPPPGAGNEVPRRFLYPSAEYSYNSANTPSATLFSPLLFWDTQ